MSNSTNNTQLRVKVTKRGVADSYGVCTRTIERYVDDPRLEFPKPLIIRGRSYFYLDEILAFEQRNPDFARRTAKNQAA